MAGGGLTSRARVAMSRALRRLPVQFAYLFGSQASGTAGATSDTDVAVYLSDRLPRARGWSVEESIADALYRLRIPVGDLDLVVLNTVGLLLRFRVIHDGQLLYERAPARRIRFEYETMRDYFDFQYYSQRDARMSIDRIAGQGFA